MTVRNRSLWIGVGFTLIVALSVLTFYDNKTGIVPSKRGWSELSSEPATGLTKSSTWHDFNQKGKLWLAEMLVGNYEKVGRHSDQWNAKVKAFLTKLAENLYGEHSRDVLVELKQLGDEILELGCTDPCFLYYHGNIVHRLQGEKAALPLVERSLAGLERSQYPRILPYYAARRLQDIYRHMGVSSKVTAAIRLKKMKYLGQAAGDSAFTNGYQRYFVRNLTYEWGQACTMPKNGEWIQREMERLPHVDPWIQLMVEGVSHIGKAWKARGSGWAHTVTEDGWKVFKKEIKHARKTLTQAHNLHPEFPEAAGWMIMVSMALGHERDERSWFDHAVSAQFDYDPAYRNILWALRPRWGGSHEKMNQFGLECLKTGRFDTEVPRYYLKMLWDVGSELEDWRDAYRSNDTYQHLQTLFTGMLSEPNRAQHKDYWKSVQATMAWAAGRYQDSNRLFVELGDEIDESVFSEFGCKRERVLGDVVLRISSHKDVFERAENHYVNNQSLKALPLYHSMLGDLSADSEASIFLRDRIAVLSMQEGYQSGEWIDCMPKSDFLGWEQKGGEWSIEPDGALIGRSKLADSKLLLLCRCHITGDYEIRGQIEAKYNAGVAIGYTDRILQKFTDFRLSGHVKKVYLGTKFTSRCQLEQAVSLDKTNTFLLRVSEGLLSLSINDTPAFTDHRIGFDEGEPHDGLFGVGGAYSYCNGYEVKFRDLQIRRLQR